MVSNYSYFPYHIDLGLVSKSPYSASVNSTFFEWIHQIGAMLGLTRSKNSRHITEEQANNILINAGCVAFAYAHNFEISKQFAVDGKAPVIEDEGNLDPGNAFLVSKDPVIWYTKIKSINNQIPDHLRVWMKRQGRAIRDPREKSMDDYLAI